MSLSKTGIASFSPNFGLRFVTLFLAIYTLTSFTWSAARGTSLERLIVEQATVATCAQIISMITPAREVVAEGFRLVSPHVRLSVVHGCEGIDTVFLLAAAILAFPAPWRKKPAGLLLGAGCVFLFSQFRLIVLFYILHYQPEWFRYLHEYIAPTLFIIVGTLVFIVWVNWALEEKNYVLPA